MARRPASTQTEPKPDESDAGASTERQASDQGTNQESGDTEKDREDAADQGDEQREDLDAGGTGELQSEAPTTHSIADPKAAPVDYSRETMRRTPHRAIPMGEMKSHAMPSAPIAVLPYGSEPRSIDTNTGLPIVAVTGNDPAAVHGDDTDADVDGGHSAAERAARV